MAADDEAVEKARALFGTGDWTGLAVLPTAGRVTEAVADDMNRRLSHGRNEGPWRRWAAARDAGSALRAIGTVLANDERDAEARDVLRRAEERGADCDSLLGEVFARSGDWESALPRLNRALSARGPQWEVAAYRLAEYAADMENRSDDAVLKLVAPAVGKVEMAVVLMADLLRRRGETDRARELLEAHADANDRVPLALGVVLEEDFGDVEEAEAAYAAAFDRGDPGAAWNLVQLVGRQEGREGEAMEWLRRAADAGCVVARAELASQGRGEDETATGQYPWVLEHYPADLAPWIVAGPHPEPTWQPLFVVDDENPLPSPGQLARAARAGLRILLQPTTRELDLSTFAAAIPDLENIDIGDGARVTGLSALIEARSLVDLNLRIAGDEAVDLSTLPALRSASVTGANFLSVCQHPQVEWLGLGLPRTSQVPTIGAPVRALTITAKHATAVLERVVQPHLLEPLTLFTARDVDLDILRRFPNLTKLDLSWCNGVVNAAALADLTALRELELYRCRNVDDVAAVRAVQNRIGGEEGTDTVVGPFVLFEDGEDGEEDPRVDLSTGHGGWEGIAEPFADRILGFSGYQMEKLVVAIAKNAGLWSRRFERDSEAEAMHLIFPTREEAVAVADAAWAVFCDPERLDVALQTARLRGRRV
jgi:tetratricopeptide (TPR) repeat protein